MRKIYFFAAAFLFAGGIFSAHATDLITLKDGRTIEVKIIRITPYEQLLYQTSDHEYGPVFAITLDRVRSIRYEDGRYQDSKAEMLKSVRSESPPPSYADKPSIAKHRKSVTAQDPDELTFGASSDPTGFIPFDDDLPIHISDGPSLVNAELTKGKLNALINISLSSDFISGKEDFGFGIGLGFNYFHHTRLGGFYAGGIGGYSYAPDGQKGMAAVSVGYKFVFSSGIFSGMFLRVGANVGAAFAADAAMFLVMPILAVGYNF